MVKKLFFICSLLLGTLIIYAQDPVEEGTACITHGFHESLMQQYPGIPSEEVFERQLQETMAAYPEAAISREVLRIPVVIHIIHNGESVGTGANIPLSHVLSQMQVLEEDFRKLSGTPGDNDNPNGVDTEIEFCLAYLGEDGRVLEELGVDRIDRNDLGIAAGPYTTGVIEGTIKPQTAWDPTKYLNVWVLDGIAGNGGGTIAGYAFRPAAVAGLPGLPPTGAAPRNDGFVVDKDFFGRQGSSDGRTATHEIGHWLGLNHLAGPFNAGDSRLNCNTDDFCDDTPNVSESIFCSQDGICEDSVSTDNYMIGFVASCRDAFTACQRDRMRTILLNSSQRLPLISSTVCDRPTVAPTAAFIVGDTETCDGRVEFFDTSTDIPTEWFWLFGDGQTSSERNPVVQYAAAGTYNVTLVATNEKGVSTTNMDVVVNLTGGTINAGEDINVCQGDQVELNATTSVENGSVLWFPTTGIEDPKSLNTIAMPNGSVRQYILSITLENGCDLRDTIAVNVTPKPTVLGLPPAGATIEEGDSIQLNAIGASTYKWSPEEGLSNPNIPNPVASPSETTTYTVEGFNNEGCSQTYEVVITVNMISSIEDGIWEGIGEIEPVFPNPASTQFSLYANFQTTGLLEVNLLDIHGKNIQPIYKNRVTNGLFEYTWKRNTEIASGFYLIEWRLGQRRFMQKIQLY